MRPLDQIARKIRSKNAGPFWLTIDVFCDNDAAFEQVRSGLTTQALAECLAIRDPCDIKRFDITSLRVVKFSLPRPDVQGSRADRDMHGAAIGLKLGELMIPYS